MTVSPTDVNVFDVGETTIDEATCPTVIAEVAVSELDVAVIVALPLPTAVTKPEEDTVATEELDVDQVTVWPVITVPPASFTVAVTVAVSPTDVNVFDVGDSSTVAAAWLTVILAVAVALPVVAVIVAVPVAIAVTKPDEDTVAVDAFEVVQATV